MHNCAHLKESSEWYPLFENGLVPIRNVLLAVNCNLDGLGQTDCHLVEVKLLTPEQKNKIAEMIAGKHGASAAEVLAWMEKEGTIPLRADQVSGTSSDMRWFI